MKFLKDVDYQPQAEKVFDQLFEELSPLLPWAEIEHIGSSAVPGAISKGDLDIFIGVPKEKYAASLNQILNFGFTIKEGTFRSSQLTMLISENYGIDLGLQLVELKSEFEFFRRFRDLLLKDKNLLTEYNALKEISSNLSEEAYRKKKSEFIEAHLKK